MSGQIPRRMGSMALVATLLAWSVTVGAPTITARADDCLAEPNSSAPAGSHWYYHMDRATQRKCWYLRATDQPVEPAAAQATSDPASLPPAPPIPPEKPATASANDPISINASDSTAPSPKAPAKPQRASASGAATAQPAQQGAQKATRQPSPALAIQAPVPQASPSSQTSDQGATTRSVPTPAWPDPPVVTFKAQEPTTPRTDTQTESIRPTIDPVAPHHAEGTARVGAATGTTTSASTMPVAMLAIVALGLVVAGILLRVVMKISVMKIFPARRQPITTDEQDFDRIDDLAHESHEDQVIEDALSEYLKRSKIPAASDDSKRRRPFQIGTDRADITRAGDSVFHITNKISRRGRRRIDVDPRQSESSDAQPQHESVNIDPEPGSIDDRHQDKARNNQRQDDTVSQPDEFLHDLQSSLIAAASEYRPRPSPLPADDGWSNDGRGKDGPSQIGDEISEREEVLERLRRDLDRLLQSPKVA
jgi:hypothetical protein